MRRRTALLALATVLVGVAGIDLATRLHWPKSANALDEAAAGVPAAAAPAYEGSSAAGCTTGLRFGDDNAIDVAVEQGWAASAAAELADDPIWTDVVDCAEPHRIEVYGVVSLPVMLDRDVASYADLLDTSTPLYRAIRANVTEQCARQVPAISRLEGQTRLDIDVVPMLSGDEHGRRAWDPVPQRAWDAGEHSFVCSFQHPDEITTSYLDVLQPTFPTDTRVCLLREQFIDCERPHDAERIALFIVDRAVETGHLDGAEVVDRSGSVNLPAAQWTLLDDVCQRYLNAVTDSPPEGLFGVTDTYPDLYPNEYGSFNVICMARSPFGTAPGDMALRSTSVYAD